MQNPPFALNVPFPTTKLVLASKPFPCILIPLFMPTTTSLFGFLSIEIPPNRSGIVNDFAKTDILGNCYRSRIRKRTTHLQQKGKALIGQFSFLKEQLSKAKLLAINGKKNCNASSTVIAFSVEQSNEQEIMEVSH